MEIWIWYFQLSDKNQVINPQEWKILHLSALEGQNNDEDWLGSTAVWK